MLTNFKRVFSFAFTDFYRNRGMSIAAVFVLTVTTLMVTGIFFVQGVSDFLVKELQAKIDVTAYFKEEVQEADILSVKDELLKDTENVKGIEYISKEQALETFLATHDEDEVFLNALNEVGGNPFLSSLNISTFGKPMEYENISRVLAQENFSSFIEKVDYSQKKDTIEKVFSITTGISRFAMGLAFFLAIIVIMVVFNTTKLVIENAKGEISTMNIIGAPRWFVQAPFIIEGGLFGLFSFFICFVVTILVAFVASPPLEVIMPGFSLSKYFIANVLIIAGIQLVCSVGLSALSSLIVVRRYLKV